MTREELIKIKGALLALNISLKYYIGWSDIDNYWDSYEEYKEFSESIDEALDIIEKELNNKKDKELLYANM